MHRDPQKYTFWRDIPPREFANYLPDPDPDLVGLLS